MVSRRCAYCNPKWLEGEWPRHRVRITKPFYMRQYTATLGEFLVFYHDVDHPVVYVSCVPPKDSVWRLYQPTGDIAKSHTDRISGLAVYAGFIPGERSCSHARASWLQSFW